MGKSKIEWTEYTWNPVVGCSHASPGCAHCYAEKMAVRLAGMGQKKYKQVIRPRYISQGEWLGPDDKYGWNGDCYLSESELEKPFHWKQHRRIFVSSMGDLFHENNPDENIDRVMDVIAGCQWHTFLFLTKRAERMAAYFKAAEARLMGKWTARACVTGYINTIPWHLPNLHIGVTAENQEMADLRIPILLQIPAALRFVSIEPILGAINLTQLDAEAAGSKEYCFINALTGRHTDMGRPCPPVPKLDWVIAGCENGPGARTFTGMAEAIVSVKDQCVSAGVPFFYKGPYGVDSYCESRIDREKKYFLYRCDKGEVRLIEGVEYRQFPEEK